MKQNILSSTRSQDPSPRGNQRLLHATITKTAAGAGSQGRARSPPPIDSTPAGIAGTPMDADAAKYQASI
jgi:hypothetical protein